MSLYRTSFELQFSINNSCAIFTNEVVSSSLLCELDFIAALITLRRNKYLDISVSIRYNERSITDTSKDARSFTRNSTAHTIQQMVGAPACCKCMHIATAVACLLLAPEPNIMQRVSKNPNTILLARTRWQIDERRCTQQSLCFVSEKARRLRRELQLDGRNCQQNHQMD